MARDANEPYMPAHFQFLVENVLCSMPGNHPLPIITYLDDIAIYGDPQDQALEDILEAIKWLGMAGLMLNLLQSQLVQATA